MTLDAKSLEELGACFEECADIDTEKGFKARKEFAAAITVPILQEVRLRSFANDLFAEEILGKNAQAVYPVADDFEVPVWTLPKLGAVPKNYIETTGSEVYVPTFNVSVAGNWSLRHAAESRLNVPLQVARNIGRAYAEYENESGMRVIVYAGTSAFAGEGLLTPRPAAIFEVPAADAAAGFFSKELLNGLILTMRRNGRTLTDLYMAPEDAADLRVWGATQADDFTRREIFTVGGIGRIWDVNLHVLDHLGAQGKYNINDSTAEFGPFQGDGSDNFNSYHMDNPNVVDANGIVATLGETQVWGFDMSVNDSLVKPVKERLTMYDDPSLHRQQQQGVYGWAQLGFAALDSRMMVMGVIDRSL